MWDDLITPLKCLRPTGPGGHGRGSRGHGCLGMCKKSIEDSHERITKAEKLKEEKAQFYKKAYADKIKRERVAKCKVKK